MPEALSRSYARFVSSLTYDQLPDQVVDKLKASVLHAMAVSLIGAKTHHGESAIALIKEEDSKPDGASILFDGTKATRGGAAFANSKLMHATNQTDSYRMLIHPGPCIIPAALATAELNGASGQEFITALAAGYEVEARIAGDFIPTTQARGFRCSPVYGTLGAAITTAKLLGLDEDQLVTALALACTFAAGTTEGPRVSGREMMFHEPQATRAGITAALLARENLRGSETCLEGDAGFYNAFTGNNRGELIYPFTIQPGDPAPTTDMAQTIEGLGSRWELLHVTPKVYPTAGYNCPVIELTTRARATHNIAPEDVESIHMEMNWLETSYPSPAFPNQDRSMPGVGSTHYFIAYTWVHGSYPPLRQRLDPGLGETESERAVIDLQEKVTVTGHQERTNFAPKITIRTKSGEEVFDEFNGDELKWDLATVTARFSPLFDEMPWPRTQLDDLVSIVGKLEQESSIENLVSTCVPA
ncbi:MAG: MmgE/PrpD family protein [Chloroflexi bacterium]|nr:MmgE/PrpD family protein [Chloroflexota bacterium]